MSRFSGDRVRREVEHSWRHDGSAAAICWTGNDLKMFSLRRLLGESSCEEMRKLRMPSGTAQLVATPQPAGRRTRLRGPYDLALAMAEIARLVLHFRLPFCGAQLLSSPEPSAKSPVIFVNIGPDARFRPAGGGQEQFKSPRATFALHSSNAQPLVTSPVANIHHPQMTKVDIMPKSIASRVVLARAGLPLSRNADIDDTGGGFAARSWVADLVQQDWFVVNESDGQARVRRLEGIQNLVRLDVSIASVCGCSRVMTLITRLRFPVATVWISPGRRVHDDGLLCS